MIVFFIHGVNTQQADYANCLIENIRDALEKEQRENSVFLREFLGKSI